VDCAEIRSGFAGGTVPEGPAVARHLEVCPACRELFENGAALGRQLARAVRPQVEVGDLFGAVERDLQGEVGLHARLRSLPSRLRAAVLVAFGLGLAALQFLAEPRGDFDRYGLDVFAGVSLVLGASLVWGALRLVRGVSVPARGEGRLAFSLLVLPALLSFVVPLGVLYDPPPPDWASPFDCFSYGVALVVPLVALSWLFERRERMPLSALLVAGAVAGIAANLLLNAHCASVHLGHLLVGHASIGAAWAAVLGLVSRLVR
jgi:hypothetical protein